MKKYIFAAILSLGILASPAFTHAAALTQDQINAIVALLQSFGADQTTINNVQVSLSGGTTVIGDPRPWCHTFNRDLTVGSSGDDVSALYTALERSGAYTPVPTVQTATPYVPVVFDEGTAGYVVRFQDKYHIRQTGYVGPITRAKLNSLYGCSTTTPSITVLSPNGGERLEIGKTYPITWRSNGYDANATVQIRLMNIATPSYEEIIITTATENSGSSWTGNTGSYSWTVPSMILTPGTASNYKVLIYIKPFGDMWGGDKGSHDESDTPFSIVASGTTSHSITVLSPNGGEQWQKGSTQSITWNPTGAGMIDIRLVSYYPSCTGADTTCPTLYSAEYVIAKQTANDGIFEWGVGKSLDGKEIPEGKYTIRVSRSIGAYAVSDESDAPFSIVAPTTPSITVLSPSSGPEGTTVTISGSGFSKGDIVYFQGQPISATEHRNSPDPSSITSWSFAVPSIPVPPQRQCVPAVTGVVCEVRVANASGSGSSAWFNVTGGTTTTPSITVLSPNGGESFEIGKTYTITWSDSPSSNQVNILLVKERQDYPGLFDFVKKPDGTTYYPAENYENKSTYQWTIPEFLKEGKYKIGISDLQVGTMPQINGGWDYSDAPFSIVAAPPVSVPITLSSVTPSSGPVGTSIRLDGCGSDSATGFTLVYSGPKSGTAAIPVETLGAASGCGYMTFSVPTDFPAGTYTLSVKNNQTGAMSTNTKTFTVTTVTAPNPTLAISPTTFVAGAPMTISVTNAAPNATIKAFCRDPNGAVCDDPVSYTTDASGQFSHTYNTTGWTLGAYRGWVTGNVASPFWSWRSIDVGFTVTAPAIAPILSVTPKTLSAGTPLNISVNGIPNAVLKVFCRDPNNSICDDAVTYGTNSLGQFFYTYKTTGWTIGSYTGWVTLNGVKSNVVSFTITAPVAGLSGGTSQTASVFNAVSGFASGDSPASQAPATTFNYVWNRDLQIGSPYQGDVIALQQALTREGVYAGEITGGFYNQTYAAVKAFQEKYGIDATGYVGLITRTKLNALY